MAEKDPRPHKSAEALVRAALANVDSKVPDAVIGAPMAGADLQRSSPDIRSSPVASVDVEPRPVASIGPMAPKRQSAG